MTDPHQQQPPAPPYFPTAGQPTGQPAQQPVAPSAPGYAQNGYSPQPTGGHPGAYPAGAYPAGAYPAGAYPAGTSKGITNSAGKIGVLIAGITFVFGLVLSLVTQITFRNGGYEFGNAFNNLGSVITFIGSAAALAFGIIGLRAKDTTHALAGIAIGVGVVGLANIVFNLLIYVSWSIF